MLGREMRKINRCDMKELVYKVLDSNEETIAILGDRCTCSQAANLEGRNSIQTYSM